MIHIPFKTAQVVSDTIIAMLDPFTHCIHTLTTVNGKEYAKHERCLSFDCITAQDIQMATHQLNHRPRKCLGFKILMRFL
jgi:IS30 family transposase